MIVLLVYDYDHDNMIILVILRLACSILYYITIIDLDVLSLI